MDILDLFSGAGGLTEGFLRENFCPVAYVEMDMHACATLKTRLFFHLLENNKNNDYYAYLNDEIDFDQLYDDNHDLLKNFNNSILNNEITETSERNIIKNIKKIMFSQDINKIDGIIGGPPCQAYSCAGRGRSKDNMKSDPRNYLYKYYLNFLDEFKPDFFVFENVPGMLSAKTEIKIFPDFEEKLYKLGYNLSHKILTATDFNVLQKRRRLIIIGHKSEENFLRFTKNKDSNKYKVWDLLDDLPKIQAGEGDDSPRNYTKKASKYLTKFKIRSSKDNVIQHNARNHNENDREIYRLVINAWNKSHKRIKYDELPERLKSHKNRKSFLDRFKIVAGDLPYSHTVMAHLSKDGHYFIHPDIEQARSLTVREAARIQSFPDNYKFEGPRTSQFKQVGNAVPPLMAEELAKHIRKILYN